MHRWLFRLLGLALGATVLLSVARSSAGQGVTFLETFDGAPDSPTATGPAGWDVQYHVRNLSNWTHMDPMAAEHGPGCEPPPATHPITMVTDGVFVCRDHLMTAISEGGYGEIVLTPPALLDWSQGEATIRFDLSTQNLGRDRDWIDIWLTPWKDNLTLPTDEGPDLQGAPRNSLVVGLHTNGASGKSVLTAAQTVDNVRRVIPYNGATSIDDALRARGLSASATRRDTFELRVSSNHVKFWMPGIGYVGVDAQIPSPLSFTQAVVQLAHHSYNPHKTCNEDGSCGPNTWHWDNVSIAPAVPFTIQRVSPRAAGPTECCRAYESPAFTWAAPAAPGSMLRYSAVSGPVTTDVSFDGGQTWQTVAPKGSTDAAADSSHARSYHVPVPVGAHEARVRAQPGYWGFAWYVADVSVWTPPGNAAAAVPSPSVNGARSSVLPSAHSYHAQGTAGQLMP